jgi:hypothetical protein
LLLERTGEPGLAAENSPRGGGEHNDNDNE